MLSDISVWKEKVKDEGLKAELDAVLGEETELYDRFYKDLQFGTGGLRGKMGVGTDCMNIYTVARASEGIALYMREKKLRKVAICYDSRLRSQEFARLAACVFAERGCEAIIVRELMPTPFLSFLTRKSAADIGIMITASHNPAYYNGYKVYNGEGCQITDGAAKEISACIAETDYFCSEYKNFEQYVCEGKIKFCEDDTEDAYLAYIREGAEGGFGNLRVTYSALNGTGYRIIPKLLRSLGVGKLDLVTEQSFPDGNFPTCPSPNPEKAETLTLGLRYAKANDSDLLLATDPDADRVGVAVLHDNEYKLLSGNEVGLLLCDYLLGKRKRNNTLPRRPVLIKTIVTSDLAYAVAREYGCEVVEVLTGFKYIGEQVGRLEREGRAADFILGFEESYGYLSGVAVRDKDAVQASALILEMAAYHKRCGRTLADALQAFYAKYGKLYHTLYTYEFAGARGSEQRENLMRVLRDSPKTALPGVEIETVKDYLTDDTFLPKADVLSFVLADETKLVVRPSGTEPMIKVYVSGRRENGALKACLDGFFKGEA